MPTSVVDAVFSGREWDDESASPTGMYGSASGGIRKSPLASTVRGVAREAQMSGSHARAAAQLQMEKACYALAQILMCDERMKALSSQDPSIPQHSMQVIDYGSPEIWAFENEWARIREKRREYVDQLRALYGDDSGPDFDLQAATRAVQTEREMANLRVRPPTPPPPSAYATEEENTAYLDTVAPADENGIRFYSMG